VPTVQQYYKLQTGEEISGKDVILLALDAKRASDLAEYIIFEHDGLANWTNCANQLGLRH